VGLLRIVCVPLLVSGVLCPLALPCLALAVAGGEGAASVTAFLALSLLALAVSVPAFLLVRLRGVRPAARDGFLVVVLTWVLVRLAGALPFALAAGLAPADAVFESTAGFATTGATVFASVEALPRSLLLWRSLCHWAGGMGVIMLTVALFPLLGVGAFQLVKAEAPGPEKEKITPTVTATAKLLYLIYCALTALLFLLCLAGGMPAFDAICHAFATMASGGVSTRNAGLAAFNSPYLEVVTTVFMLLTHVNYSLYFRALRGRFRELLDNTELKAYLAIFIAAAFLVSGALAASGYGLGRAIRQGCFQTASFLSTTGSTIADYEAWPPLARLTLFLLLFVGGCSGSTASGVKVIRWAVLGKQSVNELRRMVYPRGVFSVQLNRKLGRKDVVYGVAGFMFLYFATVAAAALSAAAAGIEPFGALSAALAVTGNVGIAFGAAGPANTYAAFPAALKWLFSAVMIAGRLELMTVFVLFSREYRRR